jgi:hypothetical protein
MEQTNLDIYGAAPIPWSRARGQLDAGAAKGWWLATSRPDGRPHLAGVGAVWVDGKLFFTSGPGTRKSRNLVLEGSAAKVSDEAKVARLAAVFASQGWPATAEGSVLTAPYSAPSAGPPPWDLYELTLERAFGVGTAEPHGAMRWRFD